MVKFIENLLITVGFIAFVLLVNEGLWRLDQLVFLLALPILLILKITGFLALVMQLWDERPGYLKAVLILLAFGLLLLSFIEDINVFTQLTAYRYGVPAQAVPVEFLVKSKGSHFIRYEYSTGRDTFQKEQYVTNRYYDEAMASNQVKIQYLPGYPNIATLLDEAALKNSTAFSLGLSICNLWLGYSSSEKFRRGLKSRVASLIS